MTEPLAPRIDAVFLPVHDLDQAIAWYERMFGFTARFVQGPYAALQVGETGLTLFHDPDFTPAEHMRFNLFVPDLEHVWRLLQARGAKVGDIEQHGTVRDFSLLDGEGNMLSVVSY